VISGITSGPETLTMPDALPKSEHAGDLGRGIAYVLLCLFVLAGANALIKWEVPRYPVTEVAFFRCFFSLIPCAILVFAKGGLSVLRTANPGRHAARAALQFTSMCLIFLAYKTMPLADAVAITFAQPLFVTALSVIILREHVGWHRWGAVAVGFIGVLVMTHPGAGSLKIGALLVVAGTALSSYVTIEIRRMVRTESATSIVAWQLGCGMIFSLVLLPLDFVMPSLYDAGILALIGLTYGIGQYWWVQATRLIPASLAATFTYSSILWASAFGFLIWGDLPTQTLLIGAAIVIASGIYIGYRETVVRRRGASLAQAGDLGSAIPTK
jgi:drug/metabolite transporter (DMT)-like permease